MPSTWMVTAFYPVLGQESLWDERWGNSNSVSSQLLGAPNFLGGMPMLKHLPVKISEFLHHVHGENSWLPLHARGDEAQGAGLGGAGASSSWEQAQIPWNDM